MILLWGHAGDRTLQAVYRALQELEATVAFYDQRRVLETEIHLEVGSQIGGTLRAGNEEIDLAEITAAYIRPFDSRWLPEIERAGPQSPEGLHALGVEDALTSWADICPALVINRPAAIATNSSKLFQAVKIREQGFLIP